MNRGAAFRECLRLLPRVRERERERENEKERETGART